MVISSMNQNVCDEMKRFCGSEKELRLKFTIRPKITEFLMKLLINERHFDEDNAKIADVKNMVDAIGNIKTFCEADEHRNSLEGLASYIMNNIILVRTEIPEETDLNKLFELINGRGQQLSQSDILKSHILNLIRHEINEDESMLIRYGQIWNACADMDEFVEHNIQQEDPSLTWKDRLVYDKESGGDEDGIMADFGNDFFDKFVKTVTKDNIIHQSESLLSIIENARENKWESDNKNENDKGAITPNNRVVRSIISFPMLLLYTLRIFLIENKLGIYDDKQQYVTYLSIMRKAY